jgi:hypothetical protein
LRGESPLDGVAGMDLGGLSPVMMLVNASSLPCPIARPLTIAFSTIGSSKSC